MLKTLLIITIIFNNVAYSTTTDKYNATAYCHKGRTASGILTRPGIIAADPRIHKLGSKVKVNGKEYLVADTGGAIKGKRIDIWMGSCSDARKFGRRIVDLDRI